ncbi:hypothetical protein [Paenibacillus koleovorans]|uniref:hypothetical protein n=1 Tax=Paenibacillus koleovorans TaxID=121608 RepID=UPI000FD8C702|nr:hypothetical protein [Paenibacillus koleovorans]
MRKFRKTAVVLSAILALGSILAACSNGGNSNESASSPSASAGATPTASVGKYDKPVSLKWLGFNVQGILAKNGSVLQKKMETDYNVKIENVQVDHYNQDQTNVFLASGESADWMFLQGEAGKIIASGAVRPITIDMLQTYAPKLLKSLDDLATREIWTRHLTVDSKLYGLPNVSKTYLTPYTLAVRKDWMDAVGATKIPTTLKELEELLLKFRNEDPDKNGKKDTYALSKWAVNSSIHTNILPYIFGAYGIAQDMWMEKDGKLVYSPVMPEYKEVLKTFQDWYKKEIFDPEVLLDDRAKILAKMDANRLGGYVDIDAWLDPTNTGGPAGKLKQSKNVDMVYIPPVKGPTGLAGSQNQPAVAKGINLYFGKKTTDEQVIRMLQIQEDIFSDPKNYAIYFNGGENAFTVDAAGNYTVKPEFNTNDSKTDTGAQRFIISNLIIDSVFPVRVSASRRGVLDQIKNFPLVKPAALQPDHVPDKWTAMFKIETEFFWKAFSGQVDIDKEWDKYVQSYMDAGGKQDQDEANKLYQASKK